MNHVNYYPKQKWGNEIDESFELTMKANQLQFSGNGYASTRQEYEVDNFIVYNSHLQSSKEILLGKNMSQNWLQFHFQLKGLSQTQKFMSKRTFVTLPQCLYIDYAPAEVCQIQFKENTDYESFGFRLSPEDFLDSFLINFKELTSLAHAIDKKESFFLANRGVPLSTAIRHIIEQLKNCTYVGQLRQLFIESKVTDLTFAMVQQIQQHQVNPLAHVGHPHEKIREAQYYIQHHLDDKLSIKSIARSVGINEFALKKGFKEVFNTSVIQYLIDLRLERAYQQMLSTNKKISTIAYETGYSAISNFSNAFFKKFGFRPSALRKPEDLF